MRRSEPAGVSNEGEHMIRTGTMSRSVGGRRVRGAALGVVVALGAMAVVAEAERAIAFQAGEGRKSVLAPDSASAIDTQKSAPGVASTADQAKKPRLTPQEARELTQALRQLQAAVQAEHPGSGGATAVNVHRPTRSVTPPTITSAELDRLVQQYLVKNDPKVDPAPITTDVEFVRRVYFDLIGKPPDARAVHGLRTRPLSRQACPSHRQPAQQQGLGQELGAVLARRGQVPRDQREPRAGSDSTRWKTG